MSYLNSNIDFDEGIYVVQISSDGPAYNSGLKIGDIITKIDGYGINKMSELRQYIYGKKAGDEVTLSIIRNKREHTVLVKLGKK